MGVDCRENAEANRMTRPSRTEFVQLHGDVFAELWRYFGPFDMDLMAHVGAVQSIRECGSGAATAVFLPPTILGVV